LWVISKTTSQADRSSRSAQASQHQSLGLERLLEWRQKLRSPYRHCKPPDNLVAVVDAKSFSKDGAGYIDGGIDAATVKEADSAAEPLMPTIAPLSLIPLAIASMGNGRVV
jgi:hypothetical protein